MRFLHLSDLHIGKNVNGFLMLDEQRYAFEQITRYIDTERPDAVVIAGDVYDRTVPGIEAVRLFDDFLTELASMNVTVMIISGNHDSPERLNFASRLLSDKKVFICGAFDGKLRNVKITDKHGDVNFWLLPFIKPLSVRSLLDKETDSYGEALAAVLKNTEIKFSERNVLVSHQFFTKAGITPERSESEIDPIGGLDAIDTNIIEKFDYVALGHLHGAQRVGSDNIRYAGSPVKYSFSERDQKKSVTLVELNKKGELNVTLLPITPIHDMREIKGEIDVLMSKEISSQGDKEDYIRAILTNEEEIIDPAGKLRTVYPNIMSIDIRNSKTDIDLSDVMADAEKVDKLSPYDLFSEFFLDVNGSAMTEEQCNIIRQLMDAEGEQ
jgi:exonuclease SbcD